jgi:hypothetical protein
MKLNNRGWGLCQMIIYCAILFFFLMVAVVLIIQLSSILQNVNIAGITTYSDIEDNVILAANNYIEKYYKEEIGTGTITITTDNMLNYKTIKETDLLPTEEDKACSGYALVKKNSDDTLNISSFIKCSNYETVGYQSWRLGD